jgi:long-chain fatty acid transport protein
MKILNGAARGLPAILAAAYFATTAAQATEGYFQNGLGARSKALAGAGVADGADATSAALNPAGIVHADTEADFAASVFMPFREFTGSGGPGFTPSGTIDSDRNAFLVPNLAINWKTIGNPYFDAVTLSLAGNGGMNTSYSGSTANPACVGTPASSGVFCGGRAGVDLQQMLLSVALAKKFGNVSVGIAPTVAVQIFQDSGLAAFSLASSDPAALTNRGNDHELGGGLRAGIEWAITPSFRAGVAGSTPTWMNSFGRYKGLFADHGDFDIPANVQGGISFDVTPALTVSVDYRHIWFSDVNSVGNPSTLLLLGLPLGANNGPGFGWNDVDTIKGGVEWKSSPDLTLRAGYSYNTQPITSRDVLLNILAPAVTQHHITAGLEYRWTNAVSLELAGMYSPREHVTGSELPGFGNPGHTIDISMDQFELTAGFKYRFGAEASASLK